MKVGFRQQLEKVVMLFPADVSVLSVMLHKPPPPTKTRIKHTETGRKRRRRNKDRRRKRRISRE